MPETYKTVRQVTGETGMRKSSVLDILTAFIGNYCARKLLLLGNVS